MVVQTGIMAIGYLLYQVVYKGSINCKGAAWRLLVMGALLYILYIMGG